MRRRAFGEAKSSPAFRTPGHSNKCLPKSELYGTTIPMAGIDLGAGGASRPRGRAGWRYNLRGELEGEKIFLFFSL
jgi:hypothetical protein